MTKETEYRHRHIEFRFWNKDENKMHYHNPLLSSMQMMTIDGAYRYVNGKLQNEVPMQYSGIRDINGKKIFENDIVKHRDWWQGDNHYPANTGTIMFDNGWIISNGNDTGPDIWQGSVDWLRLEVIGNVYENQMPKV